MARKPRLGEQQKAFADEWLANGYNVYQAAIKAGYSETYARTDAGRILDNPRVKAYIDERMKSIQSARIVKVEEAMAIVSAIARGEENVDGKLPNSQTRLKAAETMLRAYGQFTDKVEVTGDVDISAILKKAKSRADKAKTSSD